MDDTPFFPFFRPRFGPMRQSSSVRSLRQATLSQIEDRLAPALNPHLLDQNPSGHHSRNRLLPLARTFWCWIWQIFQANTSCREVVRQVQTLFALDSARSVDEGSSAYCQARSKLTLPLLEMALAHSFQSAEKRAIPSKLLQGRSLRVVDGSSVRLQDTAQNRKGFPRPESQHGCSGFPMMKILVLFSLASGAILARVVGSRFMHDLRLLMDLGSMLRPKDILIGDRAYGCYLVAVWLQSLKVDLVARLSTRSRKVDFRKALKRLGPKDGWFVWLKPANASPLLSPAQWAALPDQITVRIIRKRIDQPGFRTRELTVVTTLLDEELYPAEEILSAHFKRWRLELCLDDLKTTLGMEQLSCRSPDQANKELVVYLTAHNFLRWIMAQSAQAGQVDLERISFKGTLDGFRQWSLAMTQVRGPGKKTKKAALWRKFLEVLAADLVPLRPGRREPRAVKKRSKYPHLNKPRHLYIDRWGRNKRHRIARAKRKRSS